MDVLEATLPGVAFSGGVEREEPLPAIAGSAGARIEQEIGFGGQPQQDRAENFALCSVSFQRAVFFLLCLGSICKHELGDEERITQIWKLIIESLLGMNRSQRIQIVFRIFADEHFSGTGFSLCSDDLCKLWPSNTEQAEACSAQSNHWRVMREPGWMPKPLPLRGTPFGKTPLPLEGKGAGPVAPPPETAIGGAPKETGAEGNEPMYCE